MLSSLLPFAFHLLLFLSSIYASPVCEHLASSQAPLYGGTGNCSILNNVPIGTTCTVACNAGFYLIATNITCILLTDGTAGWYTNDTPICQPCPPQTYQPIDNSTNSECLPCATNAWTGNNIANKNCTCQIGYRLLAGRHIKDYAGEYCVGNKKKKIK